MNFRIAISNFPPAADPARGRILAALSEATGLSIELLASRLDASPSWLFDVPTRDEAEAWRALLNRQRTVTVATLPSLGRPAPSYTEALPRAEVALGGRRPAGVRDRSSAAGIGDRRSTPGVRSRSSAPGHPPSDAVVRRRGITAPTDFDSLSTSTPDAAAAPPPAASPRRGITAPVDFLGDGVHQPDTEPQVQSLSEMLEHEALPSEPTPTADGALELARRRHARGPAPTVAPAGLRRQGIDVRVSTGRRLVGPLVRVGIPLLLIGGAIALWRYLDRPVVNKPTLAEIELLDPGRVPHAPLRYTPVSDDERFSVALSIEHRVATRQVQARPVIDTIGGEARLERLGGGDDYFDYKPTGRETRRGRVTLPPVRVLDVGHTGELPTPYLPDVSDDDLPAMQAFARLLRPPFVLLPTDPVGPGARWRYRYDDEQSPLGMPVEVEVTLLGRDEQRLEFGLRFTVPDRRDPGDATSAYQRLGPFFVRYDPPVRILDFAGLGEGRATIYLDRMTPVALDIAVQFAARIEATTDFGQQLIDYSPVVSLEIGED